MWRLAFDSSENRLSPFFSLTSTKKELELSSLIRYEISFLLTFVFIYRFLYEVPGKLA
ncbi:hypothetical protein LEP1GSC058_1616 [Leptospira fainei serovar Hurstbridge str. BUT 6]|uniref:Uncharacterized protein n=1 Tax=Leptospira fainei serovar Hurstbridge str. BUT 6 TaxID=1193011 RepID=S3V2Y5_9LEPT|nr:hypothetical protein LEP1GSC058_1616 [Leptospira fainei serovar Hurstbridge str. BUT 6]